MAELIKYFIDSAINPKFQHNVYHQALYEWYVDGDTKMKNPGKSPYYSIHFFEAIKTVKENEPLDIIHLSIGMWYRALVKLFVMSEMDENGFVFTLSPKVELRNPSIDWSTVWNLASNSVIDSDDSSFLFRCLHNLLPTQQFLAKIDRSKQLSNSCNLCDLNVTDSRQHLFFDCTFNNGVGLGLLKCLKKICPSITADRILTLSLGCELHERNAAAATWIIAKVLHATWLSRRQKKETDVRRVRALIESSIMILRKSRHAALAKDIENLV